MVTEFEDQQQGEDRGGVGGDEPDADLGEDAVQADEDRKEDARGRLFFVSIIQETACFGYVLSETAGESDAFVFDGRIQYNEWERILRRRACPSK